MKTISYQELSTHNTKNDLWVVINGKVYDLTAFLPKHPGGQNIILKYGGQDATDAFEPIHPPDIISRYLGPEVCIGQFDTSTTDTMTKENSKQVKLAREKMPRLDEMYNAFDFESVAESVLTPEAWAYYSTGSVDEISMRENHNAFHRIWLRPRVMVNVKQIDLSTSMLGTAVSMPLYISSAALGKLGHPEGELVLTRAAAQMGIIQMIPTLASCSFDEIVDMAQPTQSQWLQLYVNSDRSISTKLVKHAEKRGIKGLFVTVDAAQMGRREKDMRIKYSNDGPDNMDDQLGINQKEQGESKHISSFVDPSLNWNDIDWLKGITNMPIILKGIQTPEDAVLAARHGCSGIVVSNHGGRQLDFAPSAIEILPEIMDALRVEGLDKNFEVYMDGGIRRGSDIFKAIALGAKGVGIGRPALFAMSTYGDEGVKRLIQLLQDELVMCMRLMGTPTIGHITRNMVNIRNLKDHFVQSPLDYLGRHTYEEMLPRGRINKL
ncbi:FMN-dependent dehydrogenase-domain-containing protein [Chlamydoabsidia padenii]|nr:FMN-dependent dehydrogenase-domain-containing protein [Chlamydoabsidia padenii]